MKMLKQLICWLKMWHRNRKHLGFTSKQIDLDTYKVYEEYQCLDCLRKTKDFFEVIHKETL